MRTGIHYWNYTTPGGASAIAEDIVATAKVAEDGGFDQFTVMDHWFQMDATGDPAQPMLEAYTTLGFVAAHTSRLRIGPLVVGVTYRHPGLLAKTASTLDVLSGGRSFFGIGAACNEREHAALGVPFPPIAERFERLEETLRIAKQMWSDDDGPFEGRHYRLAQTLNSPQPVSSPHPPIMIGGKGKRKTLRLAAQFAQIVNFTSADPEEVAELLDVLRRHCDDVGTDYDAIEKQALAGRLNPDAPGWLDHVKRLRDLGIDLVVLSVRPDRQLEWVKRLADEVVPRIAEV